MEVHFNGYPLKADLEARINNHCKWRGKTDMVSAMWLGYLNGIHEYGLISTDDLYDLARLLNPTGTLDNIIMSIDREPTDQDKKDAEEEEEDNKIGGADREG